MKTILVVDDEFDILTVWRLLLERHGYTVLTASNGVAALEQIRRSRPDIIVSDCMMPLMSGLQLCAALYADPDLRDIPIILCSAAADIAPQPNPRIAYARKPISFDSLLGMLEGV
jgi:CheY-like chemotaxis protein